MTDTNPLPCPFCGRKPQIIKGKRYARDGFYSHQKAGMWVWKPAVKCTTCKIERRFESVEDAVAWWNTRKEPKSAAPPRG